MKPTQEQVLQWAREAGWEMDDSCVLEPQVVWYISQGQLELLAALAYEAGRAAENEACAKVADAYEPRCDSCPSGVVNAIRARREQ